MQNKKTGRKSQLARSRRSGAGRAAFLAGVSSLAISVSGVAFAQEAADAEASGDRTLDTIVVTGIRGSLQRSMDIKRNADGVVDAISSEDIGKFPDTNLAESLQRISGVSINRVNGEGSLVTVRGFGAGFNLVTLNGRTMPTANIPIVGGDGSGTQGAGRAFDFSNIASEGVSGLEVYKTGKAAIASGGIGATVNIKTNRPLDNPGTRGTIGAKAVFDTSVDRGDEVTPEISGLYSWSNAQETFGIGVFGSFQERNSAAPSSTSASWNVFSAEDFLDPANGLITDSTVLTNTPASDTLVSVPRDSRYHFSEFERERINGQVVLQFKPTNTLKLTGDFTFAQTEETESRSDVSNWFNRPFSQVVFDENPVVATTVFLQEEIGGAKDFAFQQTLRSTMDELQSFGFNAEWDFSDSLTIVLDAHTSEAEVSPNGPMGQSEINVGMAAPVVVGQSLIYPPNGIPVQSVTIDDSINSNGDGVLNVLDVSTQVANLRSVTQTNEIDEFDLRGLWELDSRSTATFGVNYRSASNQTDNTSQRQILGDWGATNPGDVEMLLPGALQEFCVTCQFDDFDPQGASTVGFRGDAGAIFAAVSPFYDGEGNPLFVNGQSDNIVEEDILSLFAQFDTSFDVAGREARLSAGVRYEDTDVTSIAEISRPEALIWTADNDFTIVRSAETLPFSVSGEYDNFLPHLDLSIDVTSDIVARASYSKTIGRTGYNNLFANDNPNALPGPTALSNVGTGSSGNAGLLPLESDNLDISLEWYYDDASYVSIGAFEKRVKNFVGLGQSSRTLFGLRDPSSGVAGSRSGDALEALNDIGAGLNDVNLFTLTALIDDLGDVDAAVAVFEANLVGGALDQAFVDATLTALDVTPDENDPLLEFEVTGPINNREGTINGLEFAGQHFFGDTGFGIAGSYTLVEGDVGFDVGADPGEDQFALTGLSDTANVTLIYENYGFSARLAYNWRDEFLSSTNRGGGFRNPTFVEEFAQVDVNVSYDINERIAVSFEGINLTGENLRTYARSSNQLWFAQELEPRYLLGARYKF